MSSSYLSRLDEDSPGFDNFSESLFLSDALETHDLRQVRTAVELELKKSSTAVRELVLDSFDRFQKLAERAAGCSTAAAEVEVPLARAKARIESLRQRDLEFASAGASRAAAIQQQDSIRATSLHISRGWGVMLAAQSCDARNGSASIADTCSAVRLQALASLQHAFAIASVSKRSSSVSVVAQPAWASLLSALRAGIDNASQQVQFLLNSVDFTAARLQPSGELFNLLAFESATKGSDETPGPAKLEELAVCCQSLDMASWCLDALPADIAGAAGQDWMPSLVSLQKPGVLVRALLHSCSKRLSTPGGADGMDSSSDPETVLREIEAASRSQLLREILQRFDASVTRFAQDARLLSLMQPQPGGTGESSPPPGPLPPHPLQSSRDLLACILWTHVSQIVGAGSGGAPGPPAGGPGSRQGWQDFFAPGDARRFVLRVRAFDRAIASTAAAVINMGREQDDAGPRSPDESAAGELQAAAACDSGRRGLQAVADCGAIAPAGAALSDSLAVYESLCGQALQRHASTAVDELRGLVEGASAGDAGAAASGGKPGERGRRLLLAALRCVACSSPPNLVESVWRGASEVHITEADDLWRMQLEGRASRIVASGLQACQQAIATSWAAVLLAWNGCQGWTGARGGDSIGDFDAGLVARMCDAVEGGGRTGAAAGTASIDASSGSLPSHIAAILSLGVHSGCSDPTWPASGAGGGAGASESKEAPGDGRATSGLPIKQIRSVCHRMAHAPGVHACLVMGRDRRVEVNRLLDSLQRCVADLKALLLAGRRIVALEGPSGLREEASRMCSCCVVVIAGAVATFRCLGRGPAARASTSSGTEARTDAPPVAAGWQERALRALSECCAEASVAKSLDDGVGGGGDESRELGAVIAAACLAGLQEGVLARTASMAEVLVAAVEAADEKDSKLSWLQKGADGGRAGPEAGAAGEDGARRDAVLGTAGKQARQAASSRLSEWQREAVALLARAGGDLGLIESMPEFKRLRGIVTQED